MNLRYFGIILFIFLSFPIVFSSHGEYVHLFDLSKDNSTYRASYDFDFSGDFTSEDYFVVTLYHENKVLGEICRKQIKTTNQSIFKKITCEFETQGEGEYVLQSQVLRNGESWNTMKTSLYESQHAYGHYEFESLRDGGTLVRLKLEGNVSNVDVYSRIPKEVIPLLTPQNKDSLISSELPYTIIEEDPLIAWNVEKIPEDVEYRVDKEITDEQKEEFSMRIEESSTFSFIKFLAGLGIIIILLLIILPVIKSKK